MTVPRFHAAVLREAGLPADFSAAAAVHAREKACGFRFPSSIVEWYSIPGAIELLEAHLPANADRGGRLVPLGVLGQPDPDDPEVPCWGYLKLYHAGEADFPLYAVLDGSDDPAVLVDVSTLDDEDLLAPHLKRGWGTFSEFVLEWVRNGMAARNAEPGSAADTGA